MGELLRNGSDAGAADDAGNPVLVLAVAARCPPEMLSALLRAGADPDAAGPKGSPLALAVANKDAEAVRVLVERGVGAVLATLGGRGAVLVDATGAWRATPPPTTVVSTVGAGDSSLFGYLLGDLRGLGPAERLASAVAHGSAAAGLPGSTVPGADEVHPELVTVDPVSLASAG